MNTISLPIAILAGGLATRLRPMTEKIPKSMLQISGEPFIYHQLRLLSRQGLHRVVICLGYLGEQIQDYVGNGSRFKLDVQYCYDGPNLLGTGGALKNAQALLGEKFMVMYGDSYLTCDFRSVQSTYLQTNKQALMTVYHNDNQWDSSNVELSQGEILTYDKKNKTAKMQYIDYGLGVLNHEALDLIPSNQPYDLATLYQALLAQKQLVAFEVRQRFYEIGSTAGIADLNHYLNLQGELI